MDRTSLNLRVICGHLRIYRPTGQAPCNRYRHLPEACCSASSCCSGYHYLVSFSLFSSLVGPTAMHWSIDKLCSAVVPFREGHWHQHLFAVMGPPALMRHNSLVALGAFPLRPTIPLAQHLMALVLGKQFLAHLLGVPGLTFTTPQNTVNAVLEPNECTQCRCKHRASICYISVR